MSAIIKPLVLSASSLMSDGVRNPDGEDIGKIEELMIDVDSGRIAYAVLSFGGILGIGEKLFAIPWDSLRLDTENHVFIAEVSKEYLEKAPGFDKDNWPMTSDDDWLTRVYRYYKIQPYW